MLILSNKYDVPALIETCVQKLKADLHLGQLFGMDVCDIPIRKFVVAFTKHLRLADRLEIAKYKLGCERLLCGIVTIVSLGGPRCCNSEEPELKRQHGAILDHIVELLVLAHFYSCEKLKDECLSFLMEDMCDLDPEVLKKLKDHSDLLLEMVRSYHLKLQKEKSKDYDWDEEYSQEDTGDP